MFKSYIIESDLSRIVPELANDAYLWTGQTDHSGQGVEAVNTVRQDLINKGYNLRQLMKPLTLSTTKIEDEVNRLRWVANVTVTGTIILYGSDDDATWNTIQTTTISATGETSYIIPETYAYYKTGGTATFTSWLVDTTFDSLIKFKWLELIFMNAGKAEDNKYTQYALWCRQEYDNILNKMVVPVDSNDDGVVEADERSKTTSINTYK